LTTGLIFSSCALAAPSDTQADFSFMFDDNIAHASGGKAKQVDRSYTANLSQPIVLPISDNVRFLLTGSLSGEVFDLNKGLNHLIEAVHGVLQYRSSAEFGTPIIALFAKMAAEQYQSDQRDGFRYLSGISIQKTLTDRIQLFGAVVHSQRNSKSVVFDNKDNSARISLDYSLGDSGTIYLGSEYRRGDLVISGPEFWDMYNSNAYTQDDAFSSGKIYSFRFDGTTTLSTLGYNLKVGPRDSIDFFWRQANSSVNYVTPSWSKVNMNYVTNQYSVAYLLRF
jgi:hypothetical protein